MKKTASITLESVKATDAWYELGLDLGKSPEEINRIFEWGGGSTERSK